MHTPNAVEAPGSGYLTDYNADGTWRKGVKFASGQIGFFQHYDILVEGITYQEPERIESENLILIPAGEDVAWNSSIGVYGSNGTEASRPLFQGGDAIRPYGGKIDNSNSRTKVVFEEGNVSRYDNYVVALGGVEHGGLTVLTEQNAVELPSRVPDRAAVALYGLNASGKKIELFERLQAEAPSPPLEQGFVIFHGRESTCVMFRKGDMTSFAPGYKLSYEGGKSVSDPISIEPIHIRFESVGKNILTEVMLHTLDEAGAEDQLIFKGRYNGTEPAS